HRTPGEDRVRGGPRHPPARLDVGEVEAHGREAVLAQGAGEADEERMIHPGAGAVRDRDDAAGPLRGFLPRHRHLSPAGGKLASQAHGVRLRKDGRTSSPRRACSVPRTTTTRCTTHTSAYSTIGMPSGRNPTGCGVPNRRGTESASCSTSSPVETSRNTAPHRRAAAAFAFARGP